MRIDQTSFGAAAARLGRRPRFAAAAAGTVALGVGVAVPASALVRLERWLPPSFASGLRASGPPALTIDVPGVVALHGPARLRLEELEHLVGLLLFIVAAVLLVCALNVFVLVMQHLAGLGRPFAVRRAVGATRRRLRAELLAEGVLLAAAGSLAGATVGAGVAALLPEFMPAVVAPVGAGGARPAVSLMMASVPVGSALAAYGLAGPALVPAAGSIGVSVGSVVRGLSDGLAPRGLEKGLAAVQVGALVALLSGAGLLLSAPEAGGGRAAAVPDPDDLAVAELSLAAFDRVAERREALEDAAGTLRRAPGPRRVGVASTGALLGLGTRGRVLCRGCRVGPMAAPVVPVDVRLHAAGPSWFDTIGVEVLEGRGVRADDGPGARAVAVVNRAFAARLGAGAGDAAVRLPGAERSGRWHRVVGVVDDVEPPGLGSGDVPTPAVYLSALQHPPAAVRVAVRPRAGAEGLPAGDVGPTGGAVLASAWRPAAVLLAEHREPEGRARDGTAVLALAAWGASLSGLVAVTLLTLRRRWRELGIRRAVGARFRHVLARVLDEYGVLVAYGTALGAVLTLPVSRALRGVVSGVPRSAPLVVFAATAAVVALTLLLTALGPVRRAADRPPTEMIDVR